jgi:hypothetical protein
VVVGGLGILARAPIVRAHPWIPFQIIVTAT